MLLDCVRSASCGSNHRSNPCSIVGLHVLFLGAFPGVREQWPWRCPNEFALSGKSERN